MIYLVRHGQTEFNLAGRYQGGLDSPLTALGEAQARAVGETLRGLVAADAPFTTSPLGRTLATSGLIRQAGGLTGQVRIDERLAEIRLGSWDGMTDDDIEAAYPGARAGTSRWNWYFNSPDGEGYAAFAARLGDWLAEAGAETRPQVAVAHGVVSRVLRGLYGGLDREEALKLDVPQDAFYRLYKGQIERIDCVRLETGALQR